MRLKRNFFTRPVLTVAKDLLGTRLSACIDDTIRTGTIIETESYIGPRDRASHAYGNKKTERNKAEFLEGGYVYIYLVYGMYWQLNISTGKEGHPECVLIRALDIGFKNARTNGPGKLCNWLGVDKSFYGEDVTKSVRIWLEPRVASCRPCDIGKTPRINIDYAGPVWARKPWRFFLKKYEPTLAKWKSRYADAV